MYSCGRFRVYNKGDMKRPTQGKENGLWRRLDRGWRVIIVLLGVIAVVTLGVLFGDQKNGTQQPLAGEARSVATSTAGTALEVTQLSYEKIGTTLCGQGSVKNIGAEPLAYVNAIFTFRDARDNLVDYSRGAINSPAIFSPGAVAAFKRCVDDKAGVIDTGKSSIEFRGKTEHSFDERVFPYVVVRPD